MACEILEYKYQYGWDLDNFLDDDHFKNIIDPTWPLITSTMSTYTVNYKTETYRDFLEGKKRGRPKVLFNSTDNGFNTYLTQKLGMYGFSVNLTAACAGALYSFYTAEQLSLANNTPVVVFAGDNFLDGDYGMWMFNSYGALSQDTGYPFDSTSKGFKMGKGMTLYIIKHQDVKHHLSPKAVIQSFYFYTTPELSTHPGDVNDLIKHFDKINFSKIDLWNSHATGTPVGDIIEYNFFANTCKHDIPIVGYKGYFGHCMSAAGSMELGMMLDCKKNDFLQPNIIPGEKIVDDDRIIIDATNFSYKKILKASLAFGGKTVLSEIDLY